MKTTFIFSVIFSAMFTTAFAQSDKYLKAMEKAVAQYDTSKTTSSVQALYNQFERIAGVEKKEWLPSYYAGMNAIRMANREDKSRIDFWADRADVFAARADSLGGDKSEILVLKALSALARINVDFMGRGPQYVGQAIQWLEQAGQANPNNPRVPLVLGQVKLNSPEGFGGDRAGGCQMVQQALQVMEKTPVTGIAPHWGLEDARKISKRCGEAK